MSPSSPLTIGFTVGLTVIGSFAAIPSWALSHGSELTVPGVTLVADECPAGYTLHPQIDLCVAQPTCPPGSTLHPRLHQCVTPPTCPSGSSWNKNLHRCATP
jgi:hypothetical protein